MSQHIYFAYILEKIDQPSSPIFSTFIFRREKYIKKSSHVPACNFRLENTSEKMKGS